MSATKSLIAGCKKTEAEFVWNKLFFNFMAYVSEKKEVMKGQGEL